MLPMASSGSMIIYHKVIKPFVKQHEKELDSAFNVAGGVMKDAAGKGEYLQAEGVYSWSPWQIM